MSKLDFAGRSELDWKHWVTTTLRVLGGRVQEELALLGPNGEFSRQRVFARRI